MSGKITIHHLRISQSERIIWLCEELDIPYELKSYNRQPPTMLAPKEYRELHPAGTAPIIEDGPVVLAESNAIFEYILAKYGKGRLVLQPDHPNYPDYVFWLHHANGGMMPSFMGVMMRRLSGQADDSKPNFSHERLDRSMAALEQQLGKFPYVAGDQFTAADMLVLFPLTTGRMFMGFSLDAYPNVVAYLARVGNREAYRRAMEKGDPGMEPLLAANPPQRSVITFRWKWGLPIIGICGYSINTYCADSSKKILQFRIRWLCDTSYIFGQIYLVSRMRAPKKEI